ncbi:FecR family protein [Niabella drilacis]|uniref:FecR family protein n=1 Tax=Niabella drilacis (strain DSM 25811 / CCM 8410 / CCUG 62505 / LMG 26954 / E90) TaxID=1285928 RepID=A0A1G6I9L2_NIADE|nr:FecR domain-containing protein [Niabella drilacis]SDC03073.1 FecR family protein [Niabella drilacis]
MERTRFVELIRKKESGEITLLEQKELNEALAENGSYAGILQSLKLFSGADPLFNREMGGEAAGLDRLKKKIRQSEKRSRMIPGRWMAAAAVFFILITGALFYVLMNPPRQSRKAANVIATSKGSRTNLILPDGSKVWVNADTRLTYDHEFGAKTRSVYLSGEAYFEVAKDKVHPFIVHTQLMDIKAVGTAFNVRSYKDETNAQATLMEGAVEVAFKRKGTGKILLKPMEKVVVRSTMPASAGEKDLPEIAVIKVNYDSLEAAAPETRWLKNRLVFNQERLETIVKSLDRYYGCTIRVKDTVLLNRRLSGTFQDESLSEVLESFRLAAGIQYEIDKNNVLLYK